MHGLRFAPQVWIVHLCGPDVEEVHNSPGVLWRMAVQICSGNRDISCAVRLDDAMENIPVGLGVFQATSIPLRLNPDYVISPFSEISVNNTPPVLRFEPNGQKIQGPLAMLNKAPVRTASLAAPLAITVWLEDDMKYTSGTGAPLTSPRPPVTLTWSKYRGPGAVTFDKAKPEVEKLPAGTDNAAFSGKATTNVKFSEPGDYVLHLTVNDYSGDGGGGFQCCWTTGLLKVSVKP